MIISTSTDNHSNPDTTTKQLQHGIQQLDTKADCLDNYSQWARSE